jgi:hypothetical protein
MIDIKADEDAIVARIKKYVGTFQVKEYPDIPPLNYNVNDSRGEILVMFTGASVPEDSPELIKETQTRNYRWAIAIYARDRRTHQGAYEIMRLIDDALVGFQLRYHFMRYVDTQFVGIHPEQNLWVYRSTYEIMDQSIKGE